MFSSLEPNVFLFRLIDFIVFIGFKKDFSFQRIVKKNRAFYFGIITGICV